MKWRAHQKREVFIKRKKILDKLLWLYLDLTHNCHIKMNFLFSTTINLDEKKHCEYKVYASKLIPGEYKGVLVLPSDSHCVRLIVFWREEGYWRTLRKTKEVKLLAAFLGKEIDK